MKKTISIKKNREFIRMYKKSKFYVGKFMIIYSYKNKLNTNRIGITASKKVGKAVKRNRIRRLVKESLRFYENYIIDYHDLIFVIRKNEELPTFEQIKKEMKFLLKKMKVFDIEKWELSKKQ